MLDRPDVRGELDSVPIRRHSRKISERGEFLPTAFLLSGAAPDVVPLVRAGIDDDGARPPVDRYGDAALDRGEQTGHRNDRRNRERSRQDRGVARRRPRLGRDARNHAGRDARRLRRGELVRDDHRRCVGGLAPGDATEQDPKYAVSNIVEVGGSRRQILALRRDEQRTERLERVDDASFGHRVESGNA